MVFCPQCRLQQPSEHSYCLRCGSHLPVHLLGPGKAVRFFEGTKVGPRDPDQGYLRVSCYLREQSVATEDGEVLVPGRHVRISVWDNDRARCVLSLSEAEALEMATFIQAQLVPGADSVPSADRTL